ncbi:pilus assembly protein TadG-related protein [Altererythrobacter sp. CAU 1778]
MARRVHQGIRADESGAVAATYALSLFALVAVGGVAFDYARMAGLDSELQNAADQAALAGATQLDKEDGSCARAINAAIGLVSNQTLLGNDGDGLPVTINGGTAVTVSSNQCGAVPGVRFYKEKTDRADGVDPVTDDADANFIEVEVDARTANYAFTPIVGALNSGGIAAIAMAGVGSAICRVPPIMVCHPDASYDPAVDIKTDWDALAGTGIVATGHSPGNSGNKDGDPGDASAGTKWSPGNFGFLQVQNESSDTLDTRKNRNAALLRALAFDNSALDCVPIGDNKVSTGNPQGLYDAINTRFGIYDFNSTGGSTLAPCEGGACTAAPNVYMDLASNEPGKGKGAKSCKLAANDKNGKGFVMPATPYQPKYVASSTSTTRFDSAVTRMGLPRDLCHYTSYDENGTSTGDGFCGGSEDSGRFGDKAWGRADYWALNHSGVTKPSGWDSWTRYQTYLWEIENSHSKAPDCGVVGPATRRVLTIAVVTNCSELNGTSKPVDIDDFIDVFLVEPSIDNSNRFNAYKDAIYVEVIGRSKIAGGDVFSSQEVRRDTPYLIE